MELAFLARHGESVLSRRGLLNGDPAVPCPLTPRGEEQARALGRELAGEEIDLCVTSALERARRTAELALAGRDVPVLVLPELNDPRYGAFEGRPLAEYRAWAEAHGSGEAPPGRGESRRELAARYARGFRAVLARPERAVLVVAHSLPLAYLLSQDPPARRMPLVPYARPYRLPAAALERAVARLEAWAAAPTW